MAESTKEWTGERLETFIQSENTSEHLHRYAIALEYVTGKKVLDIACGEGYGSNLLAEKAQEVAGVDVSAEVIQEAANKYVRNNLRFWEGSAGSIPVESSYYDVVVSFETIEHHDRHDEMMQEIKRVLKPDGILIISSPDKENYSDKTGYKNPFHVKELYQKEFESLIGRYFKESRFFFQKFVRGSLVFPAKGSESTGGWKMYAGAYNAIEEVDIDALYSISIASDSDLASIKMSFFDGEDVVKRQQTELLDYTTFQVTENVATEVSRQIKSSLDYRLGNALLSPLRILKRLLNG